MYSYFEPPLMNLSTGYENRGWTAPTADGGGHRAVAGYNETLFRWFYGEQAKVDVYLDNATQVDLDVAIVYAENTRLRYPNYFRTPVRQHEAVVSPPLPMWAP